MNLNIHSILPRSRANGPGSRTAIWFQGCPLHCPGCFNPDTHPFEPRILISAEALAEQLVADQGKIEGLTISGGEPFEQAAGLLNLLSRVRAATPLSILVFSGYTLSELKNMPLGSAILAHIDVLIDGRYNATRHLARGLRGSANQRIHLLTDRYRLEELQQTPPAEVHIDATGHLHISGIRPPGHLGPSHSVEP